MFESRVILDGSQTSPETRFGLYRLRVVLFYMVVKRLPASSGDYAGLRVVLF